MIAAQFCCRCFAKRLRSLDSGDLVADADTGSNNMTAVMKRHTNAIDAIEVRVWSALMLAFARHTADNLGAATPRLSTQTSSPALKVESAA